MIKKNPKFTLKHFVIYFNFIITLYGRGHPLCMTKEDKINELK